LREIFGKTVLRGPLKMPGEGELKQLAGILEYWRQVCRTDQILLHRYRLQQNALAALKTLGDVVSKITELDKENFIAAAGDRAPAAALHILNTLLAESTDVGGIIERIGVSPGLLHSPFGHSATEWKRWAGVLPIDFVNAMKPANPTFDPGLGHTGSVARFIAAVVPMLTGENPSVGSVSTQLKMRTRQLRSRQEGNNKAC
jgi:hypothetical protein